MSARQRKAADSAAEGSNGKGPRGNEVLARHCKALLPVLYVWAELRIPESARPLLEPDMLVAEVWRQARAQWPKSNVEMRTWLLEIQRATFTEIFNVIRREVLFRGGAPGSIKVEKLLELSHADLSAIQQWRRQQGAASLLRQ